MKDGPNDNADVTADDELSDEILGVVSGGLHLGNSHDWESNLDQNR